MPRPVLIPHWKKTYQFLVDRHTDWKPKVFLALAVVYLLWPIDLVPDLIPVFGWLDDIGISTVAIWYVVRTAERAQ